MCCQYKKPSKNYDLKLIIPVTRHVEIRLYYTEGRKSAHNTRYALPTHRQHIHWEPVCINTHTVNYRNVCCVFTLLQYVSVNTTNIQV